jgi:hypothetical protein
MKSQFGYNKFPVAKKKADDDEPSVRTKATVVNGHTRLALEEIASIRSWAQFVEICRRQREKRGY